MAAKLDRIGGCGVPGCLDAGLFFAGGILLFGGRSEYDRYC